jgi:Ca2+-binding EF-hand superfamily protein
MPVLSPETIEFATELFNEADTDKSGTINMAELKVAATEIAEYLEMPPPTDAEITARMDILDTDGDGVVSLEEFLMFMAGIKVLLVCRAMFQAVDTDGSGSIDAKELGALLTSIYEAEGLEPPSDEKVAEMLQELDESGDGVIDFMEFCSFVIPVVVALLEDE